MYSCVPNVGVYTETADRSSSYIKASNTAMSRNPSPRPEHRDGLAEVTYKVLLLGDAGVGKTALIGNLVGRKFSNSYMTTIGIDFVKKVFDIDSAKVQLEIWDTAGQERFRTITKFQYRGTKGLLLIYDITSRGTFETLSYWLESIEKDIDTSDEEPIPVFIIGNKADLDNKRKVTKDEGRKIADCHFARGFLETSAKDGTNVVKAFYELAFAITDLNNPRMMMGYLNPRQRKLRSQSQLVALEKYQANLLASTEGSKPWPKFKLGRTGKTDQDEDEEGKKKGCCRF